MQPTHTFADNGTYGGTLTVTEGAPPASTTFSVNVDNAAPSVDAGGDVTGAPRQRGHLRRDCATDPSSIDQASLGYSWNFGDGSPTTSGRWGATHIYTAPGNYDATLTVCDKDGGCSVDGRRITVASQQRQPSLLVYFGDFIGRTGSEQRPAGDPGRSGRAPDGGGARSPSPSVARRCPATTDSRGVAATTLKVTAGRGLCAVSATWRPGGTDAQQYTGSSMTLPFLVLPR